MIRLITEKLIHLLIVFPIVFLSLKNTKPENLKVLSIFSIYFILQSTLLYLPIEFEELRIIGGNWNWTGKVFAIMGSIVFLLIYRRFKRTDYFLTFNQNKEFSKLGIITITLIFVVQAIFNLINNTPKEWDSETILFQLTMPGIDEEIAFRGIMLGLLIKILKPSSRNFLHPAVFVTSILFGLAHGLFLNDSYELIFRAYPFFNSMTLGLIWAWITMSSGSILLALVSHNLVNFGNQLINMNR